MEEVVILSAIAIFSILFDGKMTGAIRNIPCSDNTVQRRIQDMATDVIQQVVEKITAAEKFAFQLNESTDIAEQEALLELTSNRSLKELFNEKTLTEFWSQAAKLYPEV